MLDATQTKSLLTSRTFWGAAVAAGAGIAAISGHAISAEDQSVFVNNAVDIATGVATVVGAAIAIYGRLKATKKIGTSKQ
jgi:hypothetical protein